MVQYELLLDNKDYGYITGLFNRILDHFKDAGKYGSSDVTINAMPVKVNRYTNDIKKESNILGRFKHL